MGSGVDEVLSMEERKLRWRMEDGGDGEARKGKRET